MKKNRIRRINIKKIAAVVLDVGLVLSFCACGSASKKIQASISNSNLGSVTKSTSQEGSQYNNVDPIGNDLYVEFEKYWSQSEKLQENLGEVHEEISVFLRDYGQYFDKKEIMKALEDLKFKKRDKKTSDDWYVLAEYADSSNTIYFSDRLSYKTDAVIKEFKFHEFVHFLFQKNFYHSSGNLTRSGISLDEGMAALLVRESGIYAGGDFLEKNHFYVRALMELIGVDNYMKAAASHDFSQLKKYLGEYGSAMDVSRLINAIDDATLYYNQRGTKSDIKAWDIISKMYQNKHGVSIEESDDLVMKCYSNRLAGTTYDIPGAEYSSDAVSHKNYLMNPCNYISFSNSVVGDYGVLFLDDNNKAQQNAATLSK